MESFFSARSCFSLVGRKAYVRMYAVQHRKHEEEVIFFRVIASLPISDTVTRRPFTRSRANAHTTQTTFSLQSLLFLEREILTMRLGVIDAVTMVVLSLVTFPPPASAIVRYGCFLKLRPPAQAPSTSCGGRGEDVCFQNL